jgi:type VI secretion system secreted protein Hcp
MALNAFITIKGQKQGNIKGSVIQKGREGWIAVYAFHHEIVSPRDAASGLATGKRQHKPLSITKEIDKSTVPLLQALVTNENLSEVIIRFFGTDSKSGGGVEKLIYTITLTNASISGIVEDMLNNKTEDGLKMPVLEMVSLTYQKIEWTWADGGIEAEDSWSLKA